MSKSPTRTFAPAKPRTPRPPRSETRRLVIEGAFAAFIERGFMGASVDFICSKAALSRGAFYSNFANKEELFAALYERRADRLRARLASGAAKLASATDIPEFLERLLEMPDSEELDWDIINKEFVIHALRNEQARLTLVDLRSKLRADLCELIRTALMAMGKVAPGNLDEIARLAIAIHEGDTTQRGLEPDERGQVSLLAAFFPDILKSL
jgi:AcrR family transcriptional regulator